MLVRNVEHNMCISLRLATSGGNPCLARWTLVPLSYNTMALSLVLIDIAPKSVNIERMQQI